jgi:hypothetical protein
MSSGFHEMNGASLRRLLLLATFQRVSRFSVKFVSIRVHPWLKCLRLLCFFAARDRAVFIPPWRTSRG